MPKMLDAKAVTIEQARDKLGVRGKNMTNKQIAELLTFLRALCNKAIDSTIEHNL